MDLERSYKNARLEARRSRLLNDRHCAELLRTRKKATRSASDDVAEALGLTGVPSASYSSRAAAIARAIAARRSACGAIAQRPLRLLLETIGRQTDLLEDDDGLASRLHALVAMAAAWAHWVRPPDEWRCRTHNAGRQFAQLLRHLFARYDVPAWMDGVWFDAHRRDGWGRIGWYLLVGRGGNLRKAEGLPVPLTKMMVHHALQAPAGVSIEQAFRYGQACALGVESPAVRAILGSRLGQGFGTEDEEAFWLTTMSFLARHPMIDPQQIGPIFDYLYAQKFQPRLAFLNGRAVDGSPPQPGLSMTHRDPAALVDQVRQWHRQLAREQMVGRVSTSTMWPRSLVPGFDRVEGATNGHQRRFAIVELLSATALREEGAVMKHCVATYAWSCEARRTAIFSAREDGTRMLTIEVDLRSRTIVQVRGRHNAAATPVGERLVRMWAVQAGLQIGRYALSRGW